MKTSVAARGIFFRWAIKRTASSTWNRGLVHPLWILKGQLIAIVTLGQGHNLMHSQSIVVHTIVVQTSDEFVDPPYDQVHF